MPTFFLQCLKGTFFIRLTRWWAIFDGRNNRSYFLSFFPFIRMRRSIITGKSLLSCPYLFIWKKKDILKEWLLKFLLKFWTPFTHFFWGGGDGLEFLVKLYIECNFWWGFNQRNFNLRFPEALEQVNFLTYPLFFLFFLLQPEAYNFSAANHIHTGSVLKFKPVLTQWPSFSWYEVHTF